MSREQIEQRGELMIARLPTDVDLANAAEIGERLSVAVAQVTRAVIIDLSGTRYLDSAGLDMLLRLSGMLRQGRRRLLLIVPEEAPLRRLLEYAAIPPILTAYPELEAALRALRKEVSTQRDGS